MATNNGFTGLESMDALVQQLQGMGLNMTDAVKEKALEAGAEVAKRKIEEHPNVPRSEGGGPHAKDNFLIKKVSSDQYDVGLASDFFYLLFHEIGASGGTYTQGSVTLRTPAIPARPFMRPAFETHKDEIQNAMMRIIRRELGI